MKDFLLPKTGGLAVIDILGDADLSDVMALHEAARTALPADKDFFLSPQGTAYFQNFLTHQTGIMVGIRAAGKLMAQMAMAAPAPLREAIALHAITNNDVPFHHASLNDTIVVFKSMATHPDYRGNDLEKYLLDFAIGLPFSQICDHVFAQISVGDKRVWNAFAGQKFGIVAAAYDPQDGKPRFIFQKPAFGFDLIPHIIADDVDPVADFSAIVSLTQREGLIGQYEYGSKEKLSFLRNREEINLMPVVARVSAKK
ncbi:MAG: hypothetical protein WC521_00840 [Bdellovibrionales bacterium]|jgi:GNAT superfamily N-acetyltransferase